MTSLRFIRFSHLGWRSLRGLVGGLVGGSAGVSGFVRLHQFLVQ